MKILFTGANGFLGRNVIPLLKTNNHKVATLSRTDSDYNTDLSKEIPCIGENYEIIFHAAGKAHFLPKNEDENKLFFDTNLLGTQNLCKSLEIAGVPKYFYFISSVAVYGADTGNNIDEKTPLKGNTPYAESKIAAEEFLIKWCKKNQVILYILRPSLIAGKNPPGNLGEMIKAIENKKYVNVGGGKARKSVVWAADFAQVIEKGLTKNGGVYNVCEDKHPDFFTFSKVISSKLEKEMPPNIPFFVIKFIALIGDLLGSKFPLNSKKLKKITCSLTFSNAKIKRELGFQPTNVIQNFEL